MATPVIVDLGTLTVQGSSGGSQFTSGVGQIDDAHGMSLFFTSSALSSIAGIQVSQYDPAKAFPLVGGVQSSAWFNLSTAVITVTTSGSQVDIHPVSFRGLRLSITATSSGNGEIMAYVVKQISV